ncbi:hypothetical protein CC1G_14501 [Coprinopsis cinerea okayama7|uniref:Uncharacterized protein n=1 Tax=Coprinopsis cinerea (strain Okayama-7 / 130 / ATCC MYA-4618 / FGSC 9003) TaxID=240176 RepID=D6RLW1_COPC7|nr:hypothetical protein CC1G_14501 [Coprinopsis cinerea okayama7\|eukprot:XP_002911503.1 hypothetical protein CC1G_14501 [Coprinopsis cinerea okayama7\
MALSRSGELTPPDARGRSSKPYTHLKIKFLVKKQNNHWDEDVQASRKQRYYIGACLHYHVVKR